MADSKPMTTPNAALVEAILAQPVRTLILNVDTGETGEQNVVLPLDLRDAILTALQSDAAQARVEALEALLRELRSDLEAFKATTEALVEDAKDEPMTQRKIAIGGLRIQTKVSLTRIDTLLKEPTK